MAHGMNCPVNLHHNALIDSNRRIRISAPDLSEAIARAAESYSLLLLIGFEIIV